MQEVRFSIIVTCYNQREFIRAAVDSALSQPGSAGSEIIVVDDGSRDGSAEVLESYADSIRLVVFPVNRGASDARNHGASLATGEYLVFLDGDDALMPWALDVYGKIIAGRRPTVILGRRRWFEGPVPKN
jgi:glycosyltransferase involved in cell wall biosynthesis